MSGADKQLLLQNLKKTEDGLWPGILYNDFRCARWTNGHAINVENLLKYIDFRYIFLSVLFILIVWKIIFGS